MNGPVSLLIALVSYGNAYFANGDKAPTLDFNNSTLIYNSTLTFSEKTSDDPNKLIAENPKGWFNFLKKAGCKKLEIHYSHSNQGSDFQSAGFVGGGGNWFIEAKYNTHSDYWVYSESVLKKNAPDKRIWGTSLTVIKNTKPSPLQSLPINEARQNLHIALTKIAEFAANQKINFWKTVFDKANNNLTNPNPQVDYYKDFVISERLSLKAKQLLFSASLADVFGGMGSWNDQFFSKEAEPVNTKLSAELFDKINDAVIAAINNGD